jgi:hypothetical protein
VRFEHTQIAIELVVCKRDGEVVEKGQDIPSAMKQLIEQILGRTLFRPLPFFADLLSSMLKLSSKSEKKHLVILPYLAIAF